jgi:hypothetical protein
MNPSKPRGPKAVVMKPVEERVIDTAKTELMARGVGLGLSFASACKLAGVNYDTFSRWMTRGGAPLSAKKDGFEFADDYEPEEPYHQFAVLMVQAYAEAEMRAVQQIVSAGDRDWRAAAHWLSKQRPDEWGEKKDATLQIATTSGVQIFLPDNGRDTPEIVETTGAVVRELE